MKIAKVFSMLPKKTAAVIASVVIVGISAVAVNAWSPERPTYTMANPADHVTFNSITDNPDYGDERPFFDAIENKTGNTQYSDKLKVADGQELVMRMYVHNNAKTSLNDASQGYKGIARDTKVKIFLPTGRAEALRSNAYITASNAAPTTVTDTVDFYGDGNFSLTYVKDSAYAFTNAVPTGMKLSDSIVTDGALIGYDKPDGNVPGCLEYAAIITIRVKVSMDMSGYTLNKEVSKDGNTWSDSVNVKPGEEFQYSMEFKNTGNTQQNNVVIRDKLPQHMTYVPGSTIMISPGFPQGVPVGNDDLFANQGINIGNYAAGSNAYVIFKAKVNDTVPCGSTTLTNWADVRSGAGTTVIDSANVVVNKTCAPSPTPTPTPVVTPTPKPSVTPTPKPSPTPVTAYRCDALKVAKTAAQSGENLTFTVTAYAQNIGITGYIFKVNGQVVQDGVSETYIFNRTNPGTYTVTAQVKTTQGISEVGACSKQVTVAASQAIFRCDALNLDRNSIKLGEAATFTVSATAQNAQIQGYIFKVNGQTKQDGTSNAFTFKDYANGTYTVTAQVRTDKGISDAGVCSKQITVVADQQATFNCTSLTMAPINRTKALFTARGTASNATITGYIFKVNGVVRQDSTNDSYTLSEDTPGTYAVTAYVKTDKGISAVNEACSKTYTVQTAPATPTYRCKAVTVTPGANRTVRVVTEYEAENGASRKFYSIDFGDKKAPKITDKDAETYTYDQDGTYIVRVNTTF